MVEEAQRFQRRYRGELPQLQQDFLAAVFSQAKRATRLRRALLIGSTTFLGLLVIAAAVALVVIRNAQREAERQAEVARAAEATARSAEATARTAETEAKQRLAEVQAKELERQKAAEEAQRAQQAAEAAKAEVERTNNELLAALQRAQEAQLRAKGAKKRAEQSAKEARKAKEDAIRAAEKLASLLHREQERVQRLQSQLGSPIMKQLKVRAQP
jgi:hypothetical protein